MSWRRADRGFTLLELLVAMSIVAVTGSVVLGSFAAGRGVRARVRPIAEAASDELRLFEWLRRDLEAGVLAENASGRLRILRGDAVVEYRAEDAGLSRVEREGDRARVHVFRTIRTILVEEADGSWRLSAEGRARAELRIPRRRPLR